MTNLNTITGVMSTVKKNQIFEEEFLPLLDSVYTFALSQLTKRDATAAEDLVQETYLKAWRSLSSYTRGSNARAWLFTICKNLFINRYRTAKKKSAATFAFDVAVKTYVDEEETETSFHGLGEELKDQYFGDEVIRALNQLSPEYKQVLLLDLEDFKYDEISDLLGIPIGTVRSRLHRARGLMASQLRQYALTQGVGKEDRSSFQQRGTATIPEGTQETVAVPVSIPN